MADRPHALLLALLPLVACPDTKPDTGETGDTAVDTDTDTDTDTTTYTESGCYAVDASVTTCPAPADVPPGDVTPETCGATVLSVDGEGTLGSCPIYGGFAAGGWCVYPITVEPPDTACDYGRPLVIDGHARVATLYKRTDWGGRGSDARSDADRGATWARVGLAEHASIASFARFALDLLGLGAPAELVMGAHAAAADEVRHAEAAFRLASRLLGTAVGPGPLAVGASAAAQDLVAFALATAREGCVAETLSALMVGEAADRAEDAEERATLRMLARDEERHAALAWRTLRWAIDAGGAPVRDALATFFAEAPILPGEAGLLPAEIARETAVRGWREVVAPAAAVLLGGDRPSLEA